MYKCWWGLTRFYMHNSANGCVKNVKKPEGQNGYLGFAMDFTVDYR